MTPRDAATRVAEKGLKELLLAFAANPDQADFAD
jgi:hypothetical protein